MDIADIIMLIVCTPLLIMMSVLVYVLLAVMLKEEFDIELPPKAKPKESYWEILEDSVTPTYVCKACNYESDEKYWYCPCCGKLMENHRD